MTDTTRLSDEQVRAFLGIKATSEPPEVAKVIGYAIAALANEALLRGQEREHAEAQVAAMREAGLAIVPHIRTLAGKQRVVVPGLADFERLLAKETP